MCRFLVVTSDKEFSAREYLEKFAYMAEQSKAPDGDWQGDGWGYAYLKEDGTWHNGKSLSPVWLDRETFVKVPDTTALVVHARSATHKSQLGDISCNQPYVNSEMAYVFNGFLKGVRLNRVTRGKTGAERIWNMILQEYSDNHSWQDSIEEIVELMKKNTDSVNALNFAITDGENIYVNNTYLPSQVAGDYYKLYSHTDGDKKVVCSERLKGENLKPLSQQGFIKL